jgi:hypothetical protein
MINNSSRNNLSGINFYGNEMNLLGKYNYNYNYNYTSTNIKIKKLKERIINNYLIPLVSKQWDVLKQNMYFIDELQKKIQYYNDIYKSGELVAYNEMLKVFKVLIEKQKLLENYDETMNGKRDSNEIMTMVFKTSMIKLLPEYEIYDSIFGRPKRELNEKYDDDIINKIKELLKEDDITYRKIKDYVTNANVMSEELFVDGRHGSGGGNDLVK